MFSLFDRTDIGVGVTLAMDNTHLVIAVCWVSLGITIKETSSLISKGISVFAMNSVITDHQFLLTHAQIYTANVFNEKHDNGRHEDIEANNEQRANEL